ncbi:histone-lysine N-methyltransferase SUVR5 isoform X1 [Silene latifolia]|uniref:histone-lysine N-methyltransferase SUVR5 isoform X1 n=1 Tax=Silene latifolia TaxID=37657 RepID=UPI003D77A7EE
MGIDMEVLAHSAVLCTETPCHPQEKSVTESMDYEESNYAANGKLRSPEDMKADHILNSCVVNDDSKKCSNLCDHEDNRDEENQYEEACLDFQNSHVDVNTIESDSLCDNKDEELSISASKWPEHDEALALWVKWRGKWQAGIKCERADWPLATVKAKPTHDRKSYIVIFFPHTRNYSWADTSLVCAIDELPQPIAHRSHKAGVKLVEDLAVARRFIMKKLVIGLLNIADQLPIQVLAETAREVAVWRKFAAEAYGCKGYSDLGRLLLKLQNMLSEQYVNSNWQQHSFLMWAKKCQNALSAGSIEVLKEELVESLLWSEINILRDVEGQPALGAEWKMWKHEGVETFSMTNSVSAGGNTEQPCKIPTEHLSSTSLTSITTPQISRKRPKLEIRRAEPNNSQLENKSPSKITTVEIDPSFFTVMHDDTAGNIILPSKQGLISQGTLEVAKNDAELQEVTMNGVVETKNSVSRFQSRQCIAFVEAKGRQCVRWANEGDDYCCVHVMSRIPANSRKMEITPSVDTPICQGTTTLGHKCKHRSLPDTLFCKKHLVHDDEMKSPGSPGTHLKRKHDVLSNSCTDIVIVGEPQRPPESPKSIEIACCVGLGLEGNHGICPDSPTKHSLYCDKHLPMWLKRARNGRSRIITKEIFLDLLRACSSQNQKIHLHQACEVFYKLFKSILSSRNPVPKEIQLQWAVAEASKNSYVLELLMQLVAREKDRLHKIWGVVLNKNEQLPSSHVEEQALVPVVDATDYIGSFKCTICLEEFSDDQTLGAHWINNHNKEAQWLFRGYACAICLDSFTNRKVLETHVQERHHAQFVEHCMLIQCIPCGSHFGNFEELWSHVLAAHTEHFRQSKTPFPMKPESIENNSGTHGSDRRFICKLCGLKFDLLPDLGRHHQAAHMGPSLLSSRPKKKGLHFYTYRLKSGKLSRPRLKKGLGGASYRLRNSASAILKKRLKSTSSLAARVLGPASSPARLTETQCSAIAKMLCSEAHKTKARPTNREILSIARSTCCKVALQLSLEQKYGALPERLYLKAAKLCSEHDIQVSWHQEGFKCSKGCKPQEDQGLGAVLTLRTNGCGRSYSPSSNLHSECEMDECHYIIEAHHLKRKHLETTIILCDDISFGLEKVPVPCVVEKHLIDSLHTPTYSFDGRVVFLPWEAFTYVTKLLFDPSSDLSMQNMHMGCGCSQAACSSETCDHVYLFNTDYENAKDIDQKLMEGRFPYDDIGRLMLEDDFPVYECNNFCKCDKNCPNRVLQNGVRVKLEVFKTVDKGWAVRSIETILRGTFVCEFIGEVLDLQEANRRHDRYGTYQCDYIYDTSAHMKNLGNLMEGQTEYVIDATRYGNISRFINHSCSPNLASHLVLIESMDFQFAHVGLYAKRDINAGEELSFDYFYDLQPKDTLPCLCEAKNCRGRLR